MPVALNYGLHVLLEVVAKNVQVSVAFYKQSHFWNQVRTPERILLALVLLLSNLIERTWSVKTHIICFVVHDKLIRSMKVQCDRGWQICSGQVNNLLHLSSYSIKNKFDLF